MIPKTCDTCKAGDIRFDTSPCNKCCGFSNWTEHPLIELGRRDAIHQPTESSITLVNMLKPVTPTTEKKFCYECGGTCLETPENCADCGGRGCPACSSPFTPPTENKG